MPLVLELKSTEAMPILLALEGTVIMATLVVLKNREDVPVLFMLYLL